MRPGLAINYYVCDMYTVKETREKKHQARKKKTMHTYLLRGCMYKRHERGCIRRNQFYKQSRRKRESVEQARMRSNQSASDEPRSFHESSKCHCENGDAETPCQEQAHTHRPDSTNHHSHGKEIGKCSKVNRKTNK